MRSTLQKRLLQIWIVVLVLVIVIWRLRTCENEPAVQNTEHCQLSLAESDGFICEPDHMWKQRKHTFHTQDKKNLITRKTGFFFYDNWTQNFHCTNAQRVGNMGEGGKWICDVYRFKSRHDCLIYSVGSNGEFSFEVEMKKLMPHCEIHTFDKDKFICPNDSCIFHPIKFGNTNEPPNTRNWTTILKELNHTDRTIDILKMDIEGDEYAFFPLILGGNPKSFPKQITIELHPKNDSVVNEIFLELQNRGYVIFAKEENLLAGPWFYEYSFLKLNPSFFKTI